MLEFEVQKSWTTINVSFTFPNYKVTDASIINISSEPMRRVVLKLGLTYNTTSEKMKEALNILKAIPKRIENVSSKPSDTTAVFTEYTDSALNIMYIYFIEKQGDILMVTSNVNMEILDSFNKAGIDFAFPTRTIYVERMNWLIWQKRKNSTHTLSSKSPH